MNGLIERFKELGKRASVHLADDTTLEWDHGYKERDKAMEIYNAHPELHDEMKEAAKHFLWSLEDEIKQNR